MVCGILYLKWTVQCLLRGVILILVNFNNKFSFQRRSFKINTPPLAYMALGELQWSSWEPPLSCYSIFLQSTV